MSTCAKTEKLLLTIQTSLEPTQPEPLSRARLGVVAPGEELPRPGALSRNQASNKPADTKQTVRVRTAMPRSESPSSNTHLLTGFHSPISGHCLGFPDTAKSLPPARRLPLPGALFPPRWHSPGLATAGARGAAGLGSPGRGSGCPTATRPHLPLSAPLGEDPSLPPGLRAHGPCLRPPVGRRSAKALLAVEDGRPPGESPALGPHLDGRLWLSEQLSVKRVYDETHPLAPRVLKPEAAAAWSPWA